MTSEKNRVERLRNEIVRGIKDGRNGVFRDEKHDKGIGVIRGFVVMRKGLVKDFRGYEIDNTTLELLEQSGNEVQFGKKSRFGHPNMSSTALGTFLGRVKNFRKHKQSDQVLADLFIDKTAYDTPQGDLATYVLDLAENDPDAFGSSVVLNGVKLEYQLDENGNRKTDKDGNELPPLLRFKKLSAVDIVDDPAATDGMFERFTDSVQLSAEMTRFLDRLVDEPDMVQTIQGFLSRYEQNHQPPEEELDMGENNGIQYLDLTVENLKQNRPDLYDSIFEAGKSDGFKDAEQKERTRAYHIIKEAHAFNNAGVLESAIDHVEKGTSAVEAISQFKDIILDEYQKSKDTNPGPNGEPTHGDKPHLDRAKEYKQQHNCSMTEALKATAPVRV